MSRARKISSDLRHVATLAGTTAAVVEGAAIAAERARSVASFIWQRSYERSIRAGDNDEAARKNADSAVKRNLSGLNPFETALGRTLTPEQYARLKAALHARSGTFHYPL